MTREADNVPEARPSSVSKRSPYWPALHIWHVSTRRLKRILRLRRVYMMRAELNWVPTESQRLLVLTVAIGVVCGLAAVTFHFAIQVASHMLIEPAMNAPSRMRIVWTIVTPTIGGLLAGALLTYVVPNARGSGIPQVKLAFAGIGGRLRMRDSIGKFLIGSLQIGSGASLGREGPTVQICAGTASALGRIIGVQPKNLRRLLPVGAAAGIAAAFNAPIAAVTFTVEEVLGQLDQSLLSGVVVAAAVAAVIERTLLGDAMTAVHQTYSISQLQSLVVCLLIGLSAAAVALAFTGLLLKLRSGFRELRLIPQWSHPAVGGLVTGLLATVALDTMNARGVTGGGYTTLGTALNGNLTLRVMLVLCAMKLIATVFSYGSGGAGGIFAPALFIGAMLGGAGGALGRRLLPGLVDPVGAFALVGMGAVFAGIIRAPITSVLIVVEMTGSYSLILPLMIANTTSYVIARRWSPTPIYEALLEQDGFQLKVHAPQDALGKQAVSAIMPREMSPLCFAPSMSASQLLQAWHQHKPQDVFPIVDENQVLLGIVAVEDLTFLSSDLALVPLATCVDLMRPPVSVQSDDMLSVALERMVSSGIREMPVTDASGRLVGTINDAAIAQAYLGLRS